MTQQYEEQQLDVNLEREGSSNWQLTKPLALSFGNKAVLPTGVKGSIIFPIGFVGRKPTVKIIGFVGVMLASLIGFQFHQANSRITRIILLHS